MLNPVSVLIMLNPVHGVLRCWGCACLDSYLSLHRAQHPQPTASVRDSREGAGVGGRGDLCWVYVSSSALLKAKLTCGLT